MLLGCAHCGESNSLPPPWQDAPLNHRIPHYQSLQVARFFGTHDDLQNMTWKELKTFHALHANTQALCFILYNGSQMWTYCQYIVVALNSYFITV